MSPQDFLDDDGRWRCIGCGACCRKPLYHLPFDRGDGVCRELTPENQCAIYERRPAMCRVETFRDFDDPEAHLDQALDCASAFNVMVSGAA